MRSPWASLCILSSSWLFAVPFYEAPRRPIWLGLVAVGTLLGVLTFRSARLTAARSFVLFLMVPAATAAVFVPQPYGIGPAVGTVGLAVLLTHGRLSRIGAGLLFAGSVLLAQSLAVFTYYMVAPRSASLAPFAQAAVLVLRAMGASARAGPEGLLLDNGVRTLTFGVTLDNLGLLSLGVFAAGGVVMLLFARRPWRAATATIIGSTAIYVVIRFVVFALVLAVTDRMGSFWSPWTSTAALVPLAAVLSAAIHVEPRGDLTFPEVQLGNWRTWGAASSALLCALLLLGTVGFHDPGVGKPGRVVMDEGHSDWEWSSQPLDTTWYGEKSGYNYYSLYEYLDLFYQMERNTADISEEVLADCDVLVIKTPTDPFTREEIESIVRFVSSGGGLFLVGDHTNVFGTSTNINLIAERFGLRFNYDATYELSEGRLSEYEPPDAFPHPIAQHLPTFLFATSSSMQVSAAADSVITGYGLKALEADYSQTNFFPAISSAPDMRFGLMIQGAAVRFGRGRVAAFADSTVFSNFWMFMPGKPELALSYVEWLNRQNHPYGSTWIPLALACVLLVPFVLIASKLSRSEAFVALLAAALLATPLAILAYRHLDRLSYALPQARRDYVEVCFEREYSAFALPWDHTGFAADGDTSLHTFFVWNQRLGYVPRVDETLTGALASGDVVVVANPRDVPDRETIERVEEYVAGGGRLLVLGDADDSKAACNAFIAPFEMRIDSPAPEWNAACEVGEGTLVSLTPQAGLVSGGTSLLSAPAGECVCASRLVGDGVVAVVSDCDLFFNSSLGSVSQVPSERQRAIGQFEFALMRYLAEDETPVF